MALNVVALLLVLGITFMNSIFGLFSGVINVFCAIIAAVVALGYFEALNAIITEQTGLNPSYSDAACLVVLFVLSLTILRLAADKGIRGNVRVPMYLDWGGGAVAGFVIGQITVGILALGVLMLPLGGRVLQFQRYERNEENMTDARGYVEFHESKLWLRSDEFVTGLVSILSNGSLRGQTTFASVYPEFPEWVFWTGNTVQPESLTAPRRDHGDGFKEGLRVQQWWQPKGTVKARYRKVLPTRNRKEPDYTADQPYQLGDEMKLIGMRLELKDASADRAGKGSVYHRFRPTMFRVVGDVRGEPRQYAARILGGVDSEIVGALRVADIDNNFAISASGTNVIDVYFEVDEEFEPRFIEYRRHARAPVSGEPQEPPDQALTVAAGAAGTPSGSSSGTARGSTRFINTLLRPYGDIDQLPFEMSAARARGGTNVTLEGELVVSGRIAGTRESLESSRDEAKVTKFKLPEGLHLCQIRYKPYEAQSLVGQVFNYVSRTVNTYEALDSRGDRHRLVGYYAIVPRRGGEYIELFYAGGPDDPLNIAYRSMLDFKFIEGNELTAEGTQLGLLFLVPPGRTIRSIQNQTGAGIHDLDIRMRSF